MKTIRVRLPVLAHDDAQEMLDQVTDLDGVVAALLHIEEATLEVVVARAANALHVREQLWTLTHGFPASA